MAIINNPRRGMALHVALALVAVLMLVAASMVALSSMNLNLATSYTNGQVALNEAEAGVSKLMYVLNDNPKYGFPGSSSTSPPPPDVEIHGRLTSGFTDGECFHWVTFRRDRGVPWSVNNFDGSWGQGYGGRTVPKAMINAFSTGYCRGQYRTIELVVEHPPFPYALATSGRIQSSTSLIVHGTASSTAFGTGDTARPGHVVSNFVSADPTTASVVIGTSGSAPTDITGFVQACGAVRIAQPAVVRGGIFANAAALRLPAVDVRAYKNQGQEGVATITSGTLDAQTLDIMYYSGQSLTVNGGITLQNGFLYVDGNLTVTNGGIKGVGAIVVDGDVVVQGDESFNASHRVALLASGNVNLQGNGNYLQGLVYAGGSLSAKKLTVLGNVVVNNPDPTKGSTILDQVRIVSNPEATSLKYTATSSKDVVSESPPGAAGTPPYSSMTVPYGDPPQGSYSIGDAPQANDDPSRSVTLQRPPDPKYKVVSTSNIGAQFGTAPVRQKDGSYKDRSYKVLDLSLMSTDNAVTALMNSFKNALDSLSFTPADLSGSTNPYAKDLTNSGKDLAIIIAAYRQDQKRLKQLQADLAACLAAPGPPPPDCSGIEAAIAAVQADMDRLKNNYLDTLKAFLTAFVKYIKAQTASSGTYDVGSKTYTNDIVKKDYDLDVNSRFLPLGEGMKVVVWHVHHLLP